MDIGEGMIPILSELLNIFCEEIPEAPPVRTVKFNINIYPRSWTNLWASLSNENCRIG